MARKVSGNPQIAFKQGYDLGKEEGYVAGGAEAIEYARHFAVLAIYNIVQNFVKSEKKQNEMVLAFCEEQNRIYGEEFFGNNDNVLIAAEGVKKIYKEIGFLQEGK